jgi:hypothetical protein
VVHFLDDRRRADEIYPLLAPYADRNVVTTWWSPSYAGSVARYLGLLAVTARRPEAAAAHFEQALSANARMGIRSQLAHTKCDYARLLFSRNGADDRERAQTLLAEARETAERLGLIRLRERIARLKLPPLPSGGLEPKRKAILRREGHEWTIGLEPRTSRLKDGRGLAYLATLVRDPGREFHASISPQQRFRHVTGSRRSRCRRPVDVEARAAIYAGWRTSMMSSRRRDASTTRSAILRGAGAEFPPEPGAVGWGAGRAGAERASTGQRDENHGRTIERTPPSTRRQHSRGATRLLCCYEPDASRAAMGCRAQPGLRTRFMTPPPAGPMNGRRLSRIDLFLTAPRARRGLFACADPGRPRTDRGRHR